MDMEKYELMQECIDNIKEILSKGISYGMEELLGVEDLEKQILLLKKAQNDMLSESLESKHKILTNNKEKVKKI